MAWPEWWNRVVRRLPSVRTVALYGKRAIEATRAFDESWHQCFMRSCIEEAPPWIAARARLQMTMQLEVHGQHASAPFPEIKHCPQCGVLGSWKTLTSTMYLGDPFSVKAAKLPYVDPWEFRPELKNSPQGYWSGKPGVLQGANWSLPVPKWEAWLEKHNYVW